MFSRFVPVAVLFLSSALAGCAAVYPEIQTPVSDVPAGKVLEPGAPDDLIYIAIQSAQIPNRTRGGQKWDEVGGEEPDPFLKVYLNDELLFATPKQSNTFTPTWPNQQRHNYHVPAGSVLRLELWDDNPINDRPICLRKLQDIQELALEGETRILCDSGAKMVVEIAPALPKLGLGFNYELRGNVVAVTKVLDRSPAQRAGLKRWEEVIRIMDENVSGMSSGRVKSLINANAQSGVRLGVKGKNGKERELVIKQGPIYIMYTPPGERTDD